VSGQATAYADVTAAEDDGASDWASAYDDDDEEDDSDALAQWQRFSRASMLDSVADRWDASQLQKERPIPKCLERNF